MIVQIEFTKAVIDNLLYKKFSEEFFEQLFRLDNDKNNVKDIVVLNKICFRIEKGVNGLKIAIESLEIDFFYVSLTVMCLSWM